ncbi:hypothetical protein [Lactiplantibacillus pentosus]|jgi:hypothetical protein|uniref:hypothetical protein n=1 Tax=Lactiplantibacillus pentosus TaxID=1589 RepID=UPI00259B9DE6|nr:hypothetical protein [Lactiplantibacillus pentosus]WFC04185.1 hypothetical protein PGN10_04385 [Lactiplantibacillus pentosus]
MKRENSKAARIIVAFFVHDSLMFSNIEVNRKSIVIEMYERTKQSFISIDIIDLFSEEVRMVITNTVLKLECGGKELLGKSCNEQQSS